MIRWSSLCLGLGLAGAALLATACGGSASGSIGGRSTLVIGYSISMTGSLADEGKLTQEGYQIWADALNRQGGLNVNGKSLKIQLKSYDDESTPNTAANNVQKLISSDKVDFLLGPYGSSNVLQAAGTAEKNKRVIIDPEGASNSIFTNGYKYVVGNVPLATQYPSQAILFLAAQNPKPRVGIVWADDAFSKLAGQAAVDQAKAQGLNVVVSQQYPTGTTDFSSLITQAKGANADVIIAAGNEGEAEQIVKQEQQLAFTPQATIQTVGPESPNFVTVLGAAAERQFGVTSWPGPILQFTDAVFGNAPAYAAQFKQAYGTDPDDTSALATAGAEILGLAIQQADSLDQDKVLAALHTINVMTVGGPFKANPAGYNDKAVVVLGQVQQGKFLAVYPADFSLARPIFPAN